MTRSIPAYAGEPLVSRAASRAPWVYPRVCGGTVEVAHRARSPDGLSPRMRGNPSRQVCGQPGIRSIPAYAGEPHPRSPITARSEVYPRVCGGTADALAAARDGIGLSPRMRGNPAVSHTHSVPARSIPAYAGEPGCCNIPPQKEKVYPRVCGGTSLAILAFAVVPGLSPRMRGNHYRSGLRLEARRSIPAYAGEPPRGAFRRRRKWVYPRVCGGTFVSDRVRNPQMGLSPRMRGNHFRIVTALSGSGSIPAYAGEPWRRRRNSIIQRVYPRVCGGTRPGPHTPRLRHGLSPRMRGNPSGYTRGNRKIGSIPAYAGEPITATATRSNAPVYPRVCGGTPGRRPRPGGGRGLSPRMRGNLTDRRISISTSGSIPAYAGEPGQRQGLMARLGVYPRVCGGTSRNPRTVGKRRGLSPRMRGNPNPTSLCPASARSIPAYAGEPCRHNVQPLCRQVYPRVCGGTPGVETDR